MQKEYKLNTPLEVMNDTRGEFEKQDKIFVRVGGYADVKALKGYQDRVFKRFMDSMKEQQSKADTKDKKAEEKLKAEDLLSVLEMEGASEEMFEMSFELIKRCGTIGEQKVSEDLINQMQVEDMEALYEKVMKDFLSKKAISRLNSMSK